MSYTNIRYDSDVDIAKAFAEYFGSVFRPGTQYVNSDAVVVNGSDYLGIERVSSEDVDWTIKRLKSYIV